MYGKALSLSLSLSLSHTLVGFLNSCILQNSVTLASGWYIAEFVYIQNLDIDSYKTAVKQCDINCILEKRMHLAQYWFTVFFFKQL